MAKFILIQLLGWKFKGKWPHHLKEYVVIVMPHTSWHDFYMGLLVRRVLGEDIKYVAKKELFRFPFGWYFKWMGGTSLDRTPGQNKVEAIAQIFDKKQDFKLAIAPEGTRKKVKDWKTGFYYIAQRANVPVVMVAFNYGRKQIKIAPPLYTTGDKEMDFQKIKEFYSGVKGKIPENT